MNENDFVGTYTELCQEIIKHIYCLREKLETLINYVNKNYGKRNY